MSRKAIQKKESRQRERQRKRFNGPLPHFLETKYSEIYREYKELYNHLNTNHPQARDLSKTCTFRTWQRVVQCQRPETNSEPVETITRNDDSQAMPETRSEPVETITRNVDSQAMPETRSGPVETITRNDDSQAMPETRSEPVETITRNVDSQAMPETRSGPVETITRNVDSQTMPETRSEPVEIIMPETASEPVIRVEMNELVDIMADVEGHVEQILGELRQGPDLRAIMDEVEVQHEDDEGIEINPLDDIEFDIEPFDFDLEVENYQW